MTSIVIPLASGTFASHAQDVELRYALRSVEKYLKGYGEIFIIGQAPRWIKNVTVIPATDNDKIYYKERNIFNKIMLACQDSRVSEDFLFMNDDHFLLSEFEAGEFPYYYQGTVTLQAARNTPYVNSVFNTVEFLGDYKALYFDIHCPIVYNKAVFSRWIPTADWDKKYGYCIKTLYCNFDSLLVGETQQYYPDLKLSGPLSSLEIKEKIKGRLFFSTNDNVMEGGMLAVFEELYPKKSKYEK